VVASFGASVPASNVNVGAGSLQAPAPQASATPSSHINLVDLVFGTPPIGRVGMNVTLTVTSATVN